MKIYDVHIHALGGKPDPEGLIKKFDRLGLYGGCIFSSPPEGVLDGYGASIDERLKETLAWCDGYEGRFFPVLWIDPYEENVIGNMNRAAAKGICAFKIICNGFYIYEDRPMEVLTEAARLNKPVFFHSGILWNKEQASSKYNRPLHWEALLKIKGLKFSMGHCSWPWIDECIALYGKFLNSLSSGETAEMFFDITPGTPEIYRRELLTKLYTVGYDVGDNIFFGSDSTADVYDENFAVKWIRTDKKILDGLGVSTEYRKKLYSDNLMRFLGKTDVKKNHYIPEPDKVGCWSAENKNVYAVIEDYYKKLDFPKVYDEEFYDALKEIKISDAISIREYDIKEKDGKRNLLSFLFMCRALKEKYEERGIDEEIFYDTLKDIVRWTAVWSDIKGELYLGELPWLYAHLDMKLFTLGRLQFRFGRSLSDIPEKGLKKDDKIIEIHIPAGAPLLREECVKSISRAKEFFAKYFPEYEYKAFTCYSWLLGDTLKEFLPEESNIQRFSDMFEKIYYEPSDAILRFLFRWNTVRYNLRSVAASSPFAEKIKKSALAGKEFNVGYGVLKKEYGG